MPVLASCCYSAIFVLQQEADCHCLVHDSTLNSLHHRAEDTALRPESQEHANGVGTAGDDLAI